MDDTAVPELFDAISAAFEDAEADLQDALGILGVYVSGILRELPMADRYEVYESWVGHLRKTLSD